MLFRPARESDLDAIYELAQHAGKGMTTLPQDKELLRQRLQWSCDSFQKTVKQPHYEYYLFILEDPTIPKVVGTSAIEAALGNKFPFYSYKLSKHTKTCPSLTIQNSYEVLNLVNDNHGKSELCTLFLEPTFRKNSNGLLLSRARFLFMAHHLRRFPSNVIAEMRGVSDEWGNSPFWNNVGKHFFHMPFVKADQLTLSTDKQFIADLMPTDPLYVNLLNPEAQAVIGKPHPSSVPAMNILLLEGFRYNAYVDIFDAGPTLEAAIKQIRTLAASRLSIVKDVSGTVRSKHFLLANTQLDFRATVGQAILNEQSDSCVISKKTAALLAVNCGDTLRIAPIHLTEQTS